MGGRLHRIRRCLWLPESSEDDIGELLPDALSKNEREVHTTFFQETQSFSLAVAKLFQELATAPRDADGSAVVRTDAASGWATQLKAKDESTVIFQMRPSLACYHGGRVVFVTFSFEPLSAMPPPLQASRAPRAVVDAPKAPARRGQPPGSTKKKKEAALAAQAALAAAGGLRAPGRVNPELEPTDDEIEAELNTMLGAPAVATAVEA